MIVAFRRKMMGTALGGFAAGCLATMLSGAAQAETPGPLTNDVGVIEVAEGQPILIGALLVLSGRDFSLGVAASRGAEIAFDGHGNALAGRAYPG